MLLYTRTFNNVQAINYIDLNTQRSTTYSGFNNIKKGAQKYASETNGVKHTIRS